MINEALDAKWSEWEARNVIPTEERYDGISDRCINFGLTKHTQMFSSRQLLSHCTSVEVFQDLLDELQDECGGLLGELDKAALTYIAISIDKIYRLQFYNALLASESRGDRTYISSSHVFVQEQLR